MNEKSPLILRAMKGEKVERVPFWFMRQAGRYLPEYRELRAKHSMLDCIRTAELAKTITLQPLKRFDLDAAIIFADILNPLMTMGVELDFVSGEGPKIFNPVSTPSDIDRLARPEVKSGLEYTFKAIRMCADELKPRNIPVLGFCGAPFTLSCYIIEGGKLDDLKKTKHFIFSHKDAWHNLQEKLVELIVEYAAHQVEAGASAIQLFDSWAGYLGPDEYRNFVLPHLHAALKGLRERLSVPLVYFSTGTAGMLGLINSLDADVISVDWRIELKEARRALPNKVIQGNLDPLILAGPAEYLHEQAARTIREGKEIQNYIFNLGHGIIPGTPPENVALVTKIVRENGIY